MENNSKCLNKFVTKLGLTEFQHYFDKTLSIINSENYKIVPNGHIEGKPIRSFLHRRKCDSSIRELYINPDVENSLEGDNINFLWGLLHEIGHILTFGIRKGDAEMREVIAWEMAGQLMVNHFPELSLSHLDHFESRAISSLKTYWTNAQNNWNNSYEWGFDSCGARILNRIPKNF